MAKPATTHVIEIESGIGEPAFIPLTLGQELQPISVGKKGMWRVEGARVLDVHAFVYFDGNALFLQSADEASAALVDGYRVGKAWTELHAPCRIEVGAARLRFRSLIGDSDAAANAATIAASAPPVKAPPGGPGGGGGAPTPGTIPGGHGAPAQQSGGHARAAPPPARPAAGAPPEPMTFPKPERPFAPGALAHGADQDESTRIAPLESTGASRSMPAVPREPPREPPRPAAGRPVEEDLSTRPEAARAAKPATGQVQAIGTGPYAAQPQMGMQPGMGQPSMPPMVQGVMPVGSMPPGMNPNMQPGMHMQSGMHPGMQPGMQQGMHPGMQPGMQMQGAPSGSMPPAGGYGYPQQPGGYPQGYGGNPMPGGSGAYGALPSGGMPAGGPGGQSMAPGAYGAPPGGEQKPTEGLTPMSEVMKDPKQRVKLLAVGVILMGGVYLLLLDDDPPPPPPKKVAVADGGLTAEGGTMAGTSGGTLTPPAAPCPPGFQAYGEVRAGQPITCVPVPGSSGGGGNAGGGAVGDPGGGGVIASSGGVAVATDAGGAAQGGDAGKPRVTSTTQKTLERQAVDYVAIGEYQKAIGIYEQLSRQFPDNKVYSEALRILRQKLDAGAGGQ
jgi:hypothetical protein